MSVKLKDDKPTSTSIVGCCQSSSTTPDNSIVDYIEDDFDAPNNNTLYHASNASKDIKLDLMGKNQSKMDKIHFTFPKRPKVDIEFKNIKYTVKQFSFKYRTFGKYNTVLYVMR